MMTLIVADCAARARMVADAHGWPRSTWKHVRDGSDITRAPGADVYLDRTAENSSRWESIALAFTARTNPAPGPFGYAKWPYTSKIETPEGARVA